MRVWFKPEEGRCGMFDEMHPEKGIILDIRYDGVKPDFVDGLPCLAIDIHERRAYAFNIVRGDNEILSRLIRETLPTYSNFLS